MSINNLPEAEQVKPTVVRTLKPPPEIWELVHPVEAQSNSQRSFLRRHAPRAISLVLVLIVGALVAAIWTGDLRFRDVQKPATSATAQSLQVVTTPAQNDTTTSSSSTLEIDDSSVTQPASVNVSDDVKRTTPRAGKRKTGIAAEVQQGGSGDSETTARARTEPTTPKTDPQSKATDTEKKNSADSASAKPKSNATLNPVVIAPSKSASTPKAKVIQWP